jgi:hypothetical protein
MERREELRARLRDIEDRRFFLAMKDRWNNSDYELDNKLFNEEINIKKVLTN